MVRGTISRTERAEPKRRAGQAAQYRGDDAGIRSRSPKLAALAAFAGPLDLLIRASRGPRLSDAAEHGDDAYLGRRAVVAADPVVIRAQMPGVGARSQAQAQDSVTTVGIRPNEGHGIAGSAAATRG